VNDTFRIAFAGRLDEFKNPSLMFRTIHRLRQIMDGVEFHYVGTSNPNRYPEFSAIEDITIRHGFRSAHEMAQILASVHAGILTSTFEGMPRCVLETLAVGRPVVAVHLPQLEYAIRDGINGYLCHRDCSEEALIECLVTRFSTVRNAIASGQISPATVAEQIKPFTPGIQLARVYRMHREIQGRDMNTATDVFCGGRT
jgi:glycosyltransferase involved in cell wall biosynthesis